MIMITLSTFLSVIVINLYFRGDKKNRVPLWLKTVTITKGEERQCLFLAVHRLVGEDNVHAGGTATRGLRQGNILLQ